MLPRRGSLQQATRGPQSRDKRRNDSKSPRSRKTQRHQKKSLRHMTTASRISRLLLGTASPSLLPSSTRTSRPRLARNVLQPRNLNSRWETKACPFQPGSQTGVSGTAGQRDSVGRDPWIPQRAGSTEWRCWFCTDSFLSH
ncbi:exosome component 10 [Phyllostomus discolor]|uniref:Exosome component 10 n=1 Tax=Phyllostomus discolor TaxID=89673 RepID=A0A834ABV7_9CHIR|nr:exosome component 10 [Phyllostomus discolor]